MASVGCNGLRNTNESLSSVACLSLFFVYPKQLYIGPRYIEVQYYGTRTARSDNMGCTDNVKIHIMHGRFWIDITWFSRCDNLLKYRITSVSQFEFQSNSFPCVTPIHVSYHGTSERLHGEIILYIRHPGNTTMMVNVRLPDSVL